MLSLPGGASQLWGPNDDDDWQEDNSEGWQYCRSLMIFCTVPFRTEREYLFISYLCFCTSPQCCPAGSTLRFAIKIPSMGIIQRFNVSDSYHFLLLLNRNSLKVWVFQFFWNSCYPKTQKLSNCTAQLYVRSYFALCVRKDIIFQSNIMISERGLSAPQSGSFTFLSSILTMADRTETYLSVFQS